MAPNSEDEGIVIPLSSFPFPRPNPQNGNSMARALESEDEGIDIAYGEELNASETRRARYVHFKPQRRTTALKGLSLDISLSDVRRRGH